MSTRQDIASGLSLRFLGDATVLQGDEMVALPRSKKTRALLAYLALSGRARRRGALCTMFWDIPDDPKGALRWSLSKLRPILKDGEESRLQTDGDYVDIDTENVSVDVARLLAASAQPDGFESDELGDLAAAGELLEGFTLPNCPDFELWLAEQRENVTQARAGLYRALCERHGDDAETVLGYARSLADLVPSDGAARWRLVDLLYRTGRESEAERQRELAGDLLAGQPPFAANQQSPSPAPAADPPAPAGVTGATGTPDSAASIDLPLTLPDQPSIAVLPFQTFGSQPDDNIFAVGLTHDIIMRLSRLRWLFVIARGSAFNILTESTDVREIAQRLGVRYVTQGTVAIADGKMRVDVALIDAPSRTEIWVEQYFRDLSDIFAVQRDMSDAIASCLQTEIEHAEQKRALAMPSENLNAWSAYHRGVWHMHRFNAADLDTAEGMLKQSIDLDPDGSRAYAALSFVEFQRAFLRIDPDYQGRMGRSLELAHKAVAQDPREALGHWAVGRALLMFGDHDNSIEELENAIALNPNFAGAHFSLSRTLFAAGQSERGIAAADIARRLSPYDPLRFAMLSVRANCLVQQGAFEEAADWSNRAARQPNAHHHILAVAAYCHGLAGRLDLATRYRDKLHAVKPGYGLKEFLLAFPLRDSAHIELVREGLGKAGISTE